MFFGTRRNRGANKSSTVCWAVKIFKISTNPYGLPGASDVLNGSWEARSRRRCCLEKGSGGCDVPQKFDSCGHSPHTIVVSRDSGAEGIEDGLGSRTASVEG